MKAWLFAPLLLPVVALACGSTPPMPKGPPPEYEPSPIYSSTSGAATAAPPTPGELPNAPLPADVDAAAPAPATTPSADGGMGF